MDDWASNPRQKEKERTHQARAAAFEAAYPKFREALINTLKSGAGKYMADFPGEHLAVDLSGEGVRVVLGDHNLSAEAVIEASSDREEIQCRVQGRNGKEVWNESVIADELGLRNSKLDQQRTIEGIAKRVFRALL